MRVAKNKANIIRLLVLLSIFVVLHFTFVHFNNKANEIVSATSTQSLKETSQLYAHTFEIKINDQLSMLESQTRYFTDIDMNDYSTIKRTIMTTKGIGEFKRIAVANESGMTINYQGNTSGNIYLHEYFKKTIETKTPTVSLDFHLDEDGEEVLTMAVPIIQNNKATGVITGTYSKNILSNLFSVVSFNGEGFSQVITKDGKLIVESSSSQNVTSIANIIDFYHQNQNISDIDYEKIRSDIQNNNSGLVTINYVNGGKFCYYTPVGVNDWYVLSYVNDNYIMGKKKEISNYVYLLVFILSLCFLTIFIMLIQLVRAKIKADQDIENYALANEQNQSCIFDYDLKGGKIKFSGNYEYVLGKIVNPIPIEDMRRLFLNIHEDDRNVMMHIREFFAGEDENFSSELRYKCSDGSEKWFRLNGTSVKDEEGKTNKFVGTFTNVDAQIMHEQELRHIAETDLLSGLLNKSFFRKNVTKFFNKCPENTVGVLFIIDLDNFKTTNDTLGHAMGDIAIRDTAQKLNLIFSQKDILGRIGGDEFCVLMILENVSENIATKIIMDKAASLNENLRETYNNEVDAVSISASIGIALWPNHSTEYEDLFKKADSAMYYVKQHGKNGNAIFSEKMKTLD